MKILLDENLSPTLVPRRADLLRLRRHCDAFFDFELKFANCSSSLRIRRDLRTGLGARFPDSATSVVLGRYS